MYEIPLPENQTNQAAIGRFLETINGIKQQRASRQLQSGLMQIMAQGGGQGEIAKYMAGQSTLGVQRQQPKANVPGIGGFFSRIGDAVNPMSTNGVVSPLENGVADMLIKNAMVDPLDRQYKQTQYDNIISDNKRADDAAKQKSLSDMISNAGGVETPAGRSIIANQLATSGGFGPINADALKKDYTRPNQFTQMLDMLSPEEQAQAAQIKAGLQGRAATVKSPEEREYQTLRNNKLRLQEQYANETNPDKAAILKKNLAKLDAQINKIGASGSVEKQIKDWSTIRKGAIDTFGEIIDQGTYDVATRKIQELSGQSEPVAPAAATAPQQSAKIRMKSPDGQTYEVDSAEADEATKNGWIKI